MADIEWDAVVEDIKKKKKPKRQAVKERSASGPKIKKNYKSAYSTNKLEKLIAARGESAGKQLALVRGKTMVTQKKGQDSKRAQVSTHKTFDGINVLDNVIPYDKNLVVEAVNRSLAAQFGNYQAQEVQRFEGADSNGLRLHSECPI